MGCTFQSNSARDRGGAVANTSFSNTTISLCTFTNNFAGFTTGLGDARGGAMYNADSDPLVIDSEFTSNSVAVPNDGNGNRVFGGAVYNINSSPTFIGCAFTDNVADASCCSVGSRGRGGAIYSTCSNTVYSLCEFVGNQAITGDSSSNTGHGGAIYVTGGSTDIADCTFDANVADGSATFATSSRGLGGAIYATSSAVTISTTSFTTNEARCGELTSSICAFGGAIYATSSTIEVNDSTFTDNLADAGVESGSPRALGGAIYSTSVVSVRNTLFNNNRADVNGGAIYKSGSAQLTVADSTFIANMSILGSSIYSNDGSSNGTIINSRFLGW